MDNTVFNAEFRARQARPRQDLDYNDEEADHVSIFTPLVAGVIGGAIVGVITRGVLRLVFGRE